MESLHNKTKTELIEEIKILHSHLEELEKTNASLLSARDSFNESENKFRLAMEATSDGVWDWDVQTGVVYYSHSWERILGEEKLNPDYDSWEARIHPQDKTKVLNSLQNHLDNKSDSWQFEHRLQTSSKEWKWVLGRGKVVLRDKDDKPLRMVGTMTDITERKQVEQKILFNEYLLNAAQRVARFGSYELDIASGNWTSSTELDNIFGIDENYVKTVEGLGNILHPEDKKKMLSYLNDEVITAHNSFDREYRIKRINDAEERWVHGLGELEFDTNGTPVKMIGTIQDITERMRIENDLRESEEKFAAAFHASPNLIAITRISDGTILEVNEGYTRMLGYSRAESIGRTTTDLSIWANPEDRKTFVANLGMFGQITDFETTLRCKDGSLITVIDSAKSVELQGEICTLSVAYDITGRKQAEEKIKESEEKYRALYENAPLSYQSLNEEGYFIDVNPAWLRTLGYEREEVIGSWFGDFLHPDWKPHFEKNFSIFKTQGYIHNVHFKIRTREGNYLDILVEGCIGCTNDGRFKQTYCVFQDITERKQAEQALKESEEKYRSLFEQSPVSLWEEDYSDVKNHIDELKAAGVLDFRSYFENHPDEISKCAGMVKIISLNKASKTLFSIDKPEELNRGLNNFFCEESYPYFIEQLCAVAESKLTIETEKTLQTITGERKYVEVSWNVPAGYEDTFSRVIISIVDITELKRAETQILKKKNEAQRYLNIAGVMLAVMDENGSVIRMNKKGCEILGYKEEEILNQNWFDLCIQEEIREEIIEVFNQIIEEKLEFFEYYENEVVTKSGELRAIAFHNTLIRDDNNKIIGVLFSGEDITESKRINDVLRENEAFLSTIVENIPNMIFVKDPSEFRFLRFNKAGEELLGYKRDELLGKNDYDFFSKEQADFFTGKDKEVMENKKSIDIPEEEIDTRYNKKRILHTKKIPIYDKDGNPVFLLGISEDITEQKLAEKKLTESENKYRTLFENNLAGVYVSTTDGKILDCNESFVKIYGYSSREEVLQTETAHFHRNKKERDTFLQKLKEKKELVNFESEGMNKNGKIIYTIENVQLIEESLLNGTVIDITDRKQAEDELSMSEERFKSLMMQSPFVIEIYNLDGVQISVNKAYEELWNIPAERTVNEFNVLKSKEVENTGLIEYVKRAYAGEPVTVPEYVFDSTGDTEGKGMGRIRWLSTKIYPVKEKYGKVSNIVIVHQDITEQKLAEEALRISEKKLNTLVNNLPGMAYSCLNDEYYSMKFLSRGCTEITGYSPYELIDNKKVAFIDLIHPEDKNYVTSEVRRSVNEGRQYELNYRIKDKTGKIRWVWERGQEVKDELKKESFLEGIIEDITEKREAEEEIRKLSHSVEQSPASVIITDTMGNIEYVNKKFVDVTGYTAEEVIGKSPRVLKSGHMSGEGYKELWNTIASGAEWHGEFHNKKKNGEMYWESANISPLKNPDGEITHYVAVKEDITERKEAEQKLRKNQQRLDLIYNSTSDQMMLIKVVGNGIYRIISFNNAYWQKIQIIKPGVRREQILGVEIEEFARLLNWSASLLQNLIGIYEKAINEFKEINTNDYVPTEKGTIILDSHYSPIYDEKNICTHILFTSHDITERIKAEKALRESEEKFRTIFNESPIGIELYEADGTQLTANKASLNMFGIPEVSEIRTFNLFDGISLDADKKEKLHSGQPIIYQSVFDFEKVKELQLYKTGRTGKAYFDYIIKPLLNAERQTIQGYLLQVQDITVRKHVEEELKEKEKRYRTLFDLSPSGIILIDTDGIIIDVNDSFCNSVLYKSDELIGNNIRSLVPAENHQLVGEHILDILSGKIFEHVVKNIKKDGTLCDMELRESSVLLPDGRKGILSAANDITERKRAEEALRESEAKFRNLADYSPNMIFINKRGKVVYANKLAEEMTGYRKDEIYSDSFNFMELIDPEYRELIMFNLKMHSEGREVPPAEYRLRTVSGKSIDSVINTKLINYEGGTAILGIVTDITERKRIEKALQLSEKQYRELFEQSPEAIYIHLDSIIVDGNPEFVKLLGASGLDELLGKSIFDILHPDYREADKSRLKVIINPGTNAPYREEKFIRLDGNIVDVEVGAAPILLKDKQAVQVLIRDITERKRAEEALQESEEKWRSITENSADHIMLLDKETNILFSNKTFPDLTLNDVVGKSAYSLIPKPFINVARNCFSNVLNTGKQDSYETEYQTKNNETKYFSVRVGPVFKSGKVVAMVSSSTDITKRKIIENSLKESYARLRSLAERLQMIREEERASVAREIHDDLGQSLTALKMDISWLQKNPDMDRAKRTEKFNTILDLTNSTIQTVKKIASDLRPGVLDDLGLISAIEWQKDEFESRYRIKCKLAINKKDIQLTEKVSIAVFRIFQETLTNIARHSEASRVDVKLDFLENKKLILEIHDNGIGIDSEIVRSPKSFGLIGMKERVNILKGTMEIIGMPSKGTLVRVIMPY